MEEKLRIEATTEAGSDHPRSYKPWAEIMGSLFFINQIISCFATIV